MNELELEIKNEGLLLENTQNIKRVNKLEKALLEKRKEKRLLKAKNADLLLSIDKMKDKLKSFPDEVLKRIDEYYIINGITLESKGDSMLDIIVRIIIKMKEQIKRTN